MNELKELCWIVLFSIICGPAVVYVVGYLFAKVTYKMSHKASQTVEKVRSYKQLNTVLFDIDSKNRTLQEVQEERLQMKKILGGI